MSDEQTKGSVVGVIGFGWFPNEPDNPSESVVQIAWSPSEDVPMLIQMESAHHTFPEHKKPEI